MDCAQADTNHPQSPGFSMVPTGADLSPSAAAVRAALLDGLTTVEAFAEGAGKSLRKVREWMAGGMPTVYVGRTPYIPIAEARAWLLRPGTRCAPARKAGRPRKAA